MALREPADARARAPELADRLRAYLLTTTTPGERLVIRDLGCGTGSMGRWLIERLPGPQHWVLHDRNPDLLALARDGLPATAEDGAVVTTETIEADIACLGPTDFAETTVVTASALLDLLTTEEVDRIASACARSGCAALLTLTVVGQVGFDPAEELDSTFAAAFNAHQRRTVDGRRLLGPDAAAAAIDAFTRYGTVLESRPSPWRLETTSGKDGEFALVEDWLRGWVAAACEQQPELTRHADDYIERKLTAAAAGELTVTVGHVDVLALPKGSG